MLRRKSVEIFLDRIFGEALQADPEVWVVLFFTNMGAKYTWSNHQHGDSGVWSRIDRCLVNQEWLDLFPHSQAHFGLELCSDHTMILLHFDKNQLPSNNSFKFLDMWCKHPDFSQSVADVWAVEIAGTAMFSVVKRLKALKPRLRAIHRSSYSRVEERFHEAEMKLKKARLELQAVPTDQRLILQEMEAQKIFKDIKEAYNSYLFQKAKVSWLKEGDTNSSFFHRKIKQRRHKQRILEIIDRNGITVNNPHAINSAFEDFYKCLLGSSNVTIPVNQEIILQGPVLTEDQSHALTMAFSHDDIKKAFFSIPGSKAPGPDGFNSTFFKESWSIIGDDICAAVQDFFSHGQLLKQVNCTRLSLVPKCAYPQSVSDFRPIACCNTLYKGITKLIASRMNSVLPSIISPNQAGFVRGRQIFHNIAIVQDLVGAYNRKSTPPCCMLKVDIRKAYDSVEWSFLHQMLQALNFPPKFIQWILACVTTPSFSLNVNGSSHGFFQGRRGLRQGDPMSPLLFVICMEYLSRLLSFAGKQADYSFHYRCKSMALNHLVFADDLIIFCKGDYDSIMGNLRALATFAASSGLNANAGKSAIYTCNMDIAVKSRVIQETNYAEDSLPFDYLGVKISAKKLSKDDCQFLIDKIVSRIRSWGVRSLSYAGRAQLVNSVLLNLHSYWASIFVLPKKVIDGVIAVCRNYLWDGNPNSSKPGLIAWDLVCRSKNEGGLGFKESHSWNKALLGKYVWSIASKADNLWVKWINHVYLRGKDWRSYPPSSTASWYWRQIAHIKDIFRDGFSGEKWKFDAKGYSASSGYTWIRPPLTDVSWARWVWNRLNIPKHSFLCYLVMWRRLLTRDRLIRIGLATNKMCPLCDKQDESIEHVFLHCDYIKNCMSGIVYSLRICPPGANLQELSLWLIKPVAGRFRSQVVQAIFAALFYQIWVQRNASIWKGCIAPHSVVIRRIKTDVFMRISSIMPKKTSHSDRLWLSHVLG